MNSVGSCLMLKPFVHRGRADGARDLYTDEKVIDGVRGSRCIFLKDGSSGEEVEALVRCCMLADSLSTLTINSISLESRECLRIVDEVKNCTKRLLRTLSE
jgi:hypothetical protein